MLRNGYTLNLQNTRRSNDSPVLARAIRKLQKYSQRLMFYFDEHKCTIKGRPWSVSVIKCRIQSLNFSRLGVTKHIC